MNFSLGEKLTKFSLFSKFESTRQREWRHAYNDVMRC